ncbi:MAG: hypothetical protein U0T36_10785 [Saprospiraceae bacterium]|jgi:hypothetical protein
MRHFKIFFSIVVAFGLSLYIYSCSKDNEKHNVVLNQTVEIRSGGDLLDLLGTACVPGSINIGLGCNSTTFTDTMVISNHPMYPGCSFKLIFKRQECAIGQFLDVTIGDFQILDHNCAQFSTDLNNKRNLSIWSSYITDFESAMWNAIRDQVIAQKVTGNKFRCGLGQYLNINFIRASCSRYVSTKLKEGGLGISTKLSCGSQCCKTFTRVCRKSDGTLQITQTDDTDPFDINCSDPAFLMDPPLWLGTIEFITPCTVTCPYM